jgi:hypothetical protein
VAALVAALDQVAAVEASQASARGAGRHLTILVTSPAVSSRPKRLEDGEPSGIRQRVDQPCLPTEAGHILGLQHVLDESVISTIPQSD